MKKRISMLALVFFTSVAWQEVTTTSAVFGDVSLTHPYRAAIDYVQSKKIVSGYPDGTYQPDRLLNRAEFTKIIVESRFSRLEIDNCIASEGFYKRSIFSDVASAVWYEKYVCVGKMNNIIGGYPDGTFRGEQTINYAEAAKILVNSYGLEVGTGEPWFAPFLEKMTALNALPLSVDASETVQTGLRNVTRGEMAEMIYRLRSTNDTITSPDGSFSIKIPEKALPLGFLRSSIQVTKVASEDGPVEEIHGAPMVFYRLEPDGLSFREPVTFLVRTQTQRNTIPMVFLVSGGTFDMIPDPVIEINQNDQEALLSGQLSHFSELSLGFINLFELRTEPVEQQEKNQPFVITARVTKNDTQNTFYYKSAQENISILSTWVLSGGVFSSELTNIFPQIINDVPSTALTSGPKTYTASKMFSCVGVFPSSSKIRYQTSLNFTYKKSKGNLSTNHSNSLFIGTTTNTFNCIDPSGEVSEPIFSPESVIDPFDPYDFNCPGADYPTEKELSVDVEVFKLAVGQNNKQQCFIEPIIQFGSLVGPDSCAESHYHSETVYDLFGTAYLDPHPEACGHGRESEIQKGVITISEEQYDSVRMNYVSMPRRRGSGNSITIGSHSFLEKFVMSDACAHDAFIGLSSAFDYVYDTNTRHLTIAGSTSSGAFSLEGDIAEDGSFILTGSATVAGVAGTTIELDGNWISNEFDSTMITFGSNGVLPGGCPISYGLVFP
jgi:hypothetical protein